MAVEIGESAEAMLDARATRRLIALELADVNARSPDGKRAPLFFRVVPSGSDLRVELWERGELHGSRVVSGSNAGGQLVARRVALAAAELARRLQKKRQAQAERERALTAAQARAREIEARRTLNGPLALRPSLEVASIGEFSSLLAGPRLLGQWSFSKYGRVDGGLSWLAGNAPDSARSEWLELSLAPSARLPLSDVLDLDLGVDLAAAWVRLGRVRGVDAIIDQNETWSARAAGLARIEPRITRQLRLSVGAEAGLVLRQVPFQALASAETRMRGAWLSLDLGVVFTP